MGFGTAEILIILFLVCGGIGTAVVVVSIVLLVNRRNSRKEEARRIGQEGQAYGGGEQGES